MTSEIVLIIFNLITLAAAAWLYAAQSKENEREKLKIRINSGAELLSAKTFYQEQINHLQADNKDLRDRLFIKHGLPPSGVDVTKERAEKIEVEKVKKAAALQLPNNFPRGRGIVAQAQMAALAKDEQEYLKNGK